MSNKYKYPEIALRGEDRGHIIVANYSTISFPMPNIFSFNVYKFAIKYTSYRC